MIKITVQDYDYEYSRTFTNEYLNSEDYDSEEIVRSAIFLLSKTLGTDAVYKAIKNFADYELQMTDSGFLID